jgi:hypothetical protein
MAKLHKVQVSETKYQYNFNCPGCGFEHSFSEDIHKWNQDYDKPTLSPSFVIGGIYHDEKRNKITWRCHSFIKDGKIQFLNDCTHKLKGQIVDLIDCES